MLQNVSGGKTLDVIKVSGTSRERGYKYGAASKKVIRKAINAHLEFYRQCFDLHKAHVLQMARKYMPHIEKYSPEIADEIVGISEGSESSTDEILLLAAYYEIYYRYTVGIGCTAIAVAGSMTINSETFVAQNNDEALEPWGEGFGKLVHIKPDSGPEIVTYTYPGFPGQMGLNSNGIALCANTLVTNERRMGVPFQVITREVLGQRTIGDAISAAIRGNRASSGNLVIADHNGEIYDLELTPSSFDYFYSNKLMVHSNHFLSTKLRMKRDLIIGKWTDTIVRYNRMNRILQESAGMIDENRLMKIFGDHVNYPESVCRHVDTRQPLEDRMKTVDCMIYSPTRKVMWLANGNPCQTTFQTFSL